MSGPRLRVWLALLAVGAALIAAALPPAAAAVFVAAVVVLTAFLVRAGQRPPVAGPASPPASSPSAVRGAELHPLLDCFEEGVLLLDDEGMVLAANEAAARILQRPRDAMLGVSLIRASRDHALLDVLRIRSAEPTEIGLSDQLTVQATAAPVVLGPFRTVLTLRDVTALRRAERARQELIANVSHELRTPITAALAIAETLESGVDEPEQRDRFHQRLTSELNRLGAMVDRLLRLSRIEARIEEFRFTEVDVGGALQEALRRIEPVAERRSVRLESTVAAGTPAVQADRERLLEVLANLVDNAIRHSPEGGLVLLRAQAEGAFVRVDVQDQGPGIMPQDRLRVFERFFTADRSRGDWRGTGIGLAIARHIVTRHGGDIWVADATPGATLSFTLPVADEDASSPDADPAAGGGLIGD